MLQQTQVAVVGPAFQRFMAAFPSVEALAEAPLDAVMAMWAGLGYYMRARNLHQAARLIAKRGSFPDSMEALTALPGIGRSTAAAIVSLAFDRPAAILDGNVRRVLARHAGIHGWPGDAAVLARLWALAEQRLPDHDAAVYTQGLMDLGATICRRSRPDCRVCPVAVDCVARHSELTVQIPAPRPVRQRLRQALYMRLPIDRNGVWLERRPPGGIWGGLWCAPVGEALEREADFSACHELTHRTLDLRVWFVGTQSMLAAERASCTYFAWSDLVSLGMPRPMRDVLDGARRSDLADQIIEPAI